MVLKIAKLMIVLMECVYLSSWVDSYTKFIFSTDVRRRLELIQDFEMPSVSNCVKVSPDEQFICATGVLTLN